jgi:hypothetical protein
VDAVADGLKWLEGKVEGFHVEDLAQNEAFVSTVLDASQAAIRNHQQEKLEALWNAVLNVAIGRAPDEDVQLMFVNLVDSLTPWHVRILRFFQNPALNVEYDLIKFNGGAPAQLLEMFYPDLPDLQGRKDFYELAVRDLHSSGLFSSDSLQGMTSGPGMFAKRTTELGDQFLSFITSPVR